MILVLALAFTVVGCSTQEPAAEAPKAEETSTEVEAEEAPAVEEGDKDYYSMGMGSKLQHRYHEPSR